MWITLAPFEDVLHRAQQLEDAGPLPLKGQVFGVKDSIDVAGLPTTVACPAYAYTPAASAPVVARLEAAGAIVVGKTNMDQFATGLVGTRSPYGACSSVFDAEHVSGGSSSGSAVAVAAGLVDFALGTDTAGSGRVLRRVQRHHRPEAHARCLEHARRGARLSERGLRVDLCPHGVGGTADLRGRARL